MKKLQYYAMNTVGLTIAALFLITFFILAFGLDWNYESFVGSILFYICIVLCPISIVGFIGFFIFIAKTKLGRVYEEEYAQRMQSNVNRQTLSELVNFDSDTLPHYDGKGSFTMNKTWIVVFALMFTILPTILFGLILLFGSGDFYTEGYGVILLLFIGASVGTWFVVKKQLLQKVIIDEKGVHLKRYKKKTNTFTWSSVKTVGLSTNPMGRNTERCYIYFSKKKVEDSRCIVDPYKIKGVIRSAIAQRYYTVYFNTGKVK